MLITNGRVITWGKDNRILEDHAIRVEGVQIREIGPTQQLLQKYPQEERLDAGGQLVMPGNICAHTHFYGAFARGLAIPGEAPKDFPEILQKLWWPLDRSLDARRGARLGAGLPGRRGQARHNHLDRSPRLTKCDRGLAGRDRAGRRAIWPARRVVLRGHRSRRRSPDEGRDRGKHPLHEEGKGSAVWPGPSACMPA